MSHDDTDTKTATETCIDPFATDTSAAHIIDFGQIRSGITHPEDDSDRQTGGDTT